MQHDSSHLALQSPVPVSSGVMVYQAVGTPNATVAVARIFMSICLLFCYRLIPMQVAS